MTHLGQTKEAGGTMRAALNVGERILQASAMAIADAVIVSPSLNLAFGTLTLTSERLLFEPDRLTIRAKERVFGLSEIVGLEATWTRVLKLLPLWPTLVVRTRDRSTYSFAAVRPTSLGPRRWVAAIREAQASRAGASDMGATGGSLPDALKAEHVFSEGLLQGPPRPPRPATRPSGITSAKAPASGR